MPICQKNFKKFGGIAGKSVVFGSFRKSRGGRIPLGVGDFLTDDHHIAGGVDADAHCPLRNTDDRDRDIISDDDFFADSS